MDNIEKFLRKLSFDKRQTVKNVLIKILSDKTQGLDVKKLKGYTHLFRVRMGGVRIVFFQDKTTRILFIGKRGDSKYEQF